MEQQTGLSLKSPSNASNGSIEDKTAGKKQFNSNPHRRNSPCNRCRDSAFTKSLTQLSPEQKSFPKSPV